MSVKLIKTLLEYANEVVTNVSLIPMDGTAKEVAPSNPQRIGLFFQPQALGSGVSFMINDTNPTIAFLSGFGSPTEFFFNVHEHYSLPMQQWNCLAGVGVNIYVIEIIYKG